MVLLVSAAAPLILAGSHVWGSTRYGAALGLSHPGNVDSPPCGLSSSSKGAWACPYGSDRVPRESAGSVQGFLKPDLELEQGHLHHILLAKAGSRQPHI